MNSSTRSSTRLLTLVRAPKLLVMPAVYDALSAKLVEEAGFEAVQCSGLGVSASEGVPDMSILSMREMVERTRSIARAVSLPVMGDADTGYGNVVNVWHCVREFEGAGAAGMNLEDQSFPKRCGRVEGKEIIDIDEMQQKIRAAAAARLDTDFVINARTDALGLFGAEEAIRRGNAYLEAGATMVFVQGVKDLHQVAALTAGIRGPVGMNVMEHDESCATLTFAELERLGVARVSLSSSLTLAAMHGMRKALRQIREWDGTRIDPAVFAPLADLHRLSGTPEARAIEQRFAVEEGQG
jgi:2,3-dimethylmalate lyase